MDDTEGCTKKRWRTESASGPHDGGPGRPDTGSGLARRRRRTPDLEDTGATLTCLDRAIVDSLGLPPARGAVGTGAGAGGSGRMQLVAIDSVRVGAARAEGLTGCALDLRHTASVGLEIDGLLGLDFLRSFRVTLDFDREVLLLQAAD